MNEKKNKFSQSPLLSVIVPIYKVEKYLEKCVRSIQAQTYRNLEIILVDDGSPDRCGEIADRLAAEDPRIRVFHQPNSGVAAARNLGLDNMHGEFFTFVDPDDYLSEDNTYAAVMARFEGDETLDVVQFPCVAVDESGKALNVYKPTEECFYTTRQELVDNFTSSYFEYRNIYAVIWDKIFRGSTLGTMRFKKLRYSQDTMYLFDLFEQEVKILVQPEGEYRYLQREGSAIYTKPNKEKTICHLIVLAKTYRMLNNYSADRMWVMYVYLKLCWFLIAYRTRYGVQAYIPSDVLLCESPKDIRLSLPLIKKVQLWMFNKIGLKLSSSAIAIILYVPIKVIHILKRK